MAWPPQAPGARSGTPSPKSHEPWACNGNQRARRGQSNPRTAVPRITQQGRSLLVLATPAPISTCSSPPIPPCQKKSMPYPTQYQLDRSRAPAALSPYYIWYLAPAAASLAACCTLRNVRNVRCVMCTAHSRTSTNSTPTYHMPHVTTCGVYIGPRAAQHAYRLVATSSSQRCFSCASLSARLSSYFGLLLISAGSK
jgi:hypothetical protein